MLLGLLGAACLLRAVETGPQSTPQNLSGAGSASASGTNGLMPGPNDGKIAYVAARMLEMHHFLKHPLDDEFSQKFY
ncbi:MAG: hypothetical protein DME26_03870, partial [Verrucomicrobia bacterium]